MSVLQLIRGLIGKEDVNWGDSDSTFTRQTFTGGTRAMTFVDDAVIPSSVHGDFVSTHLHKQNTDSLTTSTTFGINSAGNSVTLDGSGLSAARSFTFPDTSNQALVGATDLASNSNGIGASLVGIEDSAGQITATDVEAALAENRAALDVVEAAAHNRGYKAGFVLAYSTASAITIGGGMWALTGTTNRLVTLSAQTTFTLGSAGSNGSSTDLGANQVHYIYIDDSAVESLGSSALTASEFINSTTAPAYSHAKAGWYNGSDRAIGAVLTDGSNNILSFALFGGHYYRYAAPVAEYAMAAMPSVYTSLDISSSVPKFSTRARLRLECNTASTSVVFDTSSTSVSPEIRWFGAASTEAMTVDVPISAAQAVFWYGNGSASANVQTGGYYVDEL